MIIQNTFQNDLHNCTQKLRSTLLSRSKKQELDLFAFHEIASIGFFNNSSSAETLFQKYFYLGRGSLDIPFGVSLIAQDIACLLLENFGSSMQTTKYLSELKMGRILGAIANSEKSGTNIKSNSSSVMKSGDLYELNVIKTCYTNANADLLFVSAWDQSALDPSLDVFLLPAEMAQQRAISKDIFAFHTGSTGTCSSHIGDFQPNQFRLGAKRSGYSVLKTCFNLERALISALVAGVLDGCIEWTIDTLTTMKRSDFDYLKQPWIQDKITLAFLTKQHLNLIWKELIADTNKEMMLMGLDAKQSELATLKLLCAREAHQSFLSLFEAIGHQATLNESPVQKALSDITILKFLGGTQELQKEQLWISITKNYESLTNNYDNEKSHRTPRRTTTL